MKIRAVVKPRIERKDKCCNDSDYSTESDISQRLESSQRKYDNIRGNLEMGIIFFLWGEKKKWGTIFLGHFLQKRTILEGIRSIQSGEYGKDVVSFRTVKRQQMCAPCRAL